MDEKKSVPSLGTPVAIVIAGLVIAGAVVYGNYQTPAPKAETEGGNWTALFENLEPVSASEHIQGSPSAPITIIEYSDLECPYCKVFHQVMNQYMASKQDGEVAWVYRHFPLDSIHTKARPEAVAAECANSLGGNTAFWQFIDELFTITPSNDGLDLAQLPVIAEKIGLDVTAFNTCLDSEAPAEQVADDYNRGLEIGVDGTPFVIVVGPSGQAYPIFRQDPSTIEEKEVQTIIADLMNLYNVELQ